MPDGKWVSTSVAAELWTRAFGLPTTGDTMRNWCKRGNPRLEHVHVWHAGDRYVIELGSLLDFFEAASQRLARVAAEERGRQ